MELALPDTLTRCLSRIVEKLDTVINRDTYQLGGGTVLAARWNHRHSIDLDLFFTGHRRIDTREAEVSKTASTIFDTCVK